MGGGGMSERVSLSRQIAAIEAALGIISGSRPKPRASELELIMSDANAGIETLRWNERNEAKIRRAFGNVEGDGL